MGLRAVMKPTVITLSLLGLLSTILNIIQVLNGNLCFSTVVTDTFVETWDPVDGYYSGTSRLSTSGYKEGSHNIELSTACSETYIPREHNFFCAFNSNHLNCHQTMRFSQVTYTNDISCDCRTNQSYGYPFVIIVSPGTNIMQGLQYSETSFYCSSNLNVSRCSLNRIFYKGFILTCIVFIVGMILINAMSDGVLRGFFAWLATGEYGNAAYDWLEKQGFFSYCDNHKNKPFKLLPGQRVLRLCKKSDIEKDMPQGSRGVTVTLDVDVEDGRVLGNYFYHSSNLTIQVSVVDGKNLREVATKVYFVDWRGPRNLNSVKVNVEGYAKLVRCMEDLSKGIPTLDRMMGHILTIEEIVEFIVEASEDASLMEVTFDEEKVFFGI